jgi:archaellum component FlaC
MKSFCHTIDQHSFTFEATVNFAYQVTTTINGLWLEGISYLKPIGVPGVDRSEELNSYIKQNRSKCRVRTSFNKIMLIIPSPYVCEYITIDLHHPCEKIDKLLDEIDSLSKTIDELDEENNRLEKKVIELTNTYEEETASLNTANETLQKENAALVAQIKDLTDEVSECRTQIKDLTDEVSECRMQIEDLTDEVNECRGSDY